MIVKVKICENTIRHDDTIDTASVTPRQMFEKWDVNYEGKQANLNGETIFGDDLDKTLDELSDEIDPSKTMYLGVISKHDNAR